MSQLLKDLAKNSDVAYCTLYKLYYTPLVLFALKYLDTEDEAKDLVQDVFISMLGQRREFDTITALKGYLYSAVRNRALNSIRHSHIKEKYVEKSLKQLNDQDIFYDQVIEEDVFGMLFQAIDTLSPRCKEVMHLTMDGHKISEVANIMGIATDTAKEYKKIGKRHLVDQLRNSGYILLILSGL